MKQFFQRTYKNRVTYKIPLEKLVNAITSFKDNETVIDHFYDQERREGFFRGKSYYLTFEIHRVDGGIILETTTTCKLPFNLAKTYSQGLATYIEQHI